MTCDDVVMMTLPPPHTHTLTPLFPPFSLPSLNPPLLTPLSLPPSTPRCVHCEKCSNPLSTLSLPFLTRSYPPPLTPSYPPLPPGAFAARSVRPLLWRRPFDPVANDGEARGKGRGRGGDKGRERTKDRDGGRDKSRGRDKDRGRDWPCRQCLRINDHHHHHHFVSGCGGGSGQCRGSRGSHGCQYHYFHCQYQYH